MAIMNNNFKQVNMVTEKQLKSLHYFADYFFGARKVLFSKENKDMQRMRSLIDFVNGRDGKKH